MVPFLWRRGAKREPGRAKHQEPGWFVQLPIIGGLNQPPRLRPLRRLRGIFLMGAATPPCQRRGVSRPNISSIVLDEKPTNATNCRLTIRRRMSLLNNKWGKAVLAA